MADGNYSVPLNPNSPLYARDPALYAVLNEILDTKPFASYAPVDDPILGLMPKTITAGRSFVWGGYVASKGGASASMKDEAAIAYSSPNNARWILESDRLLTRKFNVDQVDIEQFARVPSGAFIDAVKEKYFDAWRVTKKYWAATLNAGHGWGDIGQVRVAGTPAVGAKLYVDGSVVANVDGGYELTFSTGGYPWAPLSTQSLIVGDAGKDATGYFIRPSAVTTPAAVAVGDYVHYVGFRDATDTTQYANGRPKAPWGMNSWNPTQTIRDADGGSFMTVPFCNHVRDFFTDRVAGKALTAAAGDKMYQVLGDAFDEAIMSWGQGSEKGQRIFMSPRAYNYLKREMQPLQIGYDQMAQKDEIGRDNWRIRGYGDILEHITVVPTMSDTVARITDVQNWEYLMLSQYGDLTYSSNDTSLKREDIQAAAAPSDLLRNGVLNSAFIDSFIQAQPGQVGDLSLSTDIYLRLLGNFRTYQPNLNTAIDLSALINA